MCGDHAGPKFRMHAAADSTGRHERFHRMLITWLRIALLFLLRLIVPAPPRRTRIDSSAPCPACGSRKGSIETVQAGQNNVVVQHTCATCKCHWCEQPIRSDVAIRAGNSVIPPTRA